MRTTARLKRITRIVNNLVETEITNEKSTLRKIVDTIYYPSLASIRCSGREIKMEREQNGRRRTKEQEPLNRESRKTSASLERILID